MNCTKWSYTRSCIRLSSMWSAQNFESFAKEWFDFYFGIQRRKYEYEPIYCELRKGYLAEDLNTEKIERIAELKQRKKDRIMNKRQQKKDKKKKG